MAQLAKGNAISFYLRNRISQKLKDVSQQLKDAQAQGVPGCIGIYDNTPFGYVSADSLLEAMYGDLCFPVVFPEEKPVVLPTFHGGSRRMTEQANTSVSAVAIIANRGAGVVMELFHNRHAAVPFPVGLLERFKIPEFFYPQDARGSWERIPANSLAVWNE